MYYCHCSTTGAQEEAAGAVITGLEETRGIDNLYLERISVLTTFLCHEVQLKKFGANLQSASEGAGKTQRLK